MKLILGSASPWRKTILAQAGYEFITMAANIDEQAIRDPNPQQLAAKLAQAKAQALLPQITEAAILITCDQLVLCNHEIREKPQNIEQAQYYLESYQHYPATTITAVTITNNQTHQQISDLDEATITFHPIPQDVIKALIEKGDIFACAGGFQIEGDAKLSPYVKHITGDIDSVKGLPMRMVSAMLKQIAP